MMDIKGLFVWTLGLVIRVIQLIRTLEKTICFVPFNYLDHDLLNLAYKNTKTHVTKIRNFYNYVVKCTTGLREWLH